MEDKSASEWARARARSDSSKGRAAGGSGVASNNNGSHEREPNQPGSSGMHGASSSGCYIGSSGDIAQEEVAGRVARGVEPGDGSLSLRQWLDKPERSVDLMECLHIFRQAVEIVNVAHSEGIIVHRLRPSSFVISAYNRISLVESMLCNDALDRRHCIESTPKLSPLGDCQRATEEPEESNTYLAPQQILHEEISWYTSPEELAEAPSSFSSDIYRLGVLLFELVCTFSSTEEKLNTMSNLRHRVLPPQLLLQCPKEASFCLWLLHPQSSTRPKLSELLQSEFLNEQREEREAVTKLREEIEEQELLLEFLLQMQRQKTEHANRLHDTIGWIYSDIEEVLQKQPFVKSDSCPEPSKNECSTSKNVEHQSRSENLSISGSRKRYRPEFRDSFDDGYSHPTMHKSETLTENRESIRSKSTRVMKNFKKLESIYISTRSRMTKPTQKLLCRSSDISRGSTVVNGGSRDNNSGSNKDRWVNPFLGGLNSYLSFSKLKVRSDLKQSDLLNSSNLVCSLGFDRDKEFFATAGVARKIKVFEYHMTLNEDRRIHYPVIEMAAKSKLSSICWNSYIKSHIASCDFEGVVQTWDATRGQVFLEMMEHERRVWSVDFSSVDPMKLASGSDDGTVKLWNINQGGSTGTIKTKANVCCVQFPPDSSRSLVFGSADHRIYCYDLRNTKMPWCTLVGHSKTVSYVKFVDSTTLVSSSTDNSLKLWDLSACASQVLDTPIQTFTGHTNVKNFAGLSVYDGYIATGSETNEVFIYHKAFPMPLLSFKFSDTGDSLSDREADDATQFVSAVCWHGQSTALIAANSTGNIKLLEMV